MVIKPVRSRKRATTAETSAPAETPCNSVANSLKLVVDYVAPESLTPPARKLRKHGQRQLAQLEASIRHFGFNEPILVNNKGQIICGYARWLAACELGLAEIPVICAAHLTPEQLRMYAIAANKTGLLGEWDEEELRIEFGELLDISLDLSIDLTGFSTCEIDKLLTEPAKKEEGESADNPPTGPAVTQPGDLWLLGEHKLLCGDALAEVSYRALLGEERAQMIFSDPPYNVEMKSISGKGKAKHTDFAMAAGEMSRDQFTEFLAAVFALMAAYSVDGSIHYQCIDWRHGLEMQQAGERAYSELKNLIVWNKGSGGMGSFYRSQHEIIYAWKQGKAKHINNFGLGENGRYRSNVWTYPGNNSFHKNRDKELAAHATVKPIDLVADAIRDCSHSGGIILDAFGGSGTTLLAAERTRRRARLIELEPKYCDVIIRRWQEMTGGQAILAATEESFDAVRESRGIDIDEGEDA